MSHREIIRKLGGSKIVAAEIGKRQNTVVKWATTRGIPAVLWPEVVRMAKRHGLCGITIEVLESASGRCAPRNRTSVASATACVEV